MNKIDFKELLKPVSCSCGKIHTCPIRHIEIGSGAIRKIGPLVEAYHHICWLRIRIPMLSAVSR